MVASQIDEKVHFRCFRVVGILHEPHHKGVAWVVVDARFHHWDRWNSLLGDTTTRMVDRQCWLGPCIQPQMFDAAGTPTFRPGRTLKEPHAMRNRGMEALRPLVRELRNMNAIPEWCRLAAASLQV